MAPRDSTGVPGPVVLGAALVVLGGVFLLREFGAFPNVGVASLLLLGLGGLLLLLTVTGNRRGWLAPVVLLGIGTFLLLRDIGLIRRGVAVWPIVLIVIGLAVLLDARSRGKDGSEKVWR